MSFKASDREARNVIYSLHKMTTDIIFGHGRALQFERYITCKSIDITDTALFTNTPRHHTALVYHKMWRAEARVPEADRVMERGAVGEEVRCTFRHSS